MVGLGGMVNSWGGVKEHAEYTYTVYQLLIHTLIRNYNPYKHMHACMHAQAHVNTYNSNGFWLYFSIFNLFISFCYLPGNCCF